MINPALMKKLIEKADGIWNSDVAPSTVVGWHVTPEALYLFVKRHNFGFRDTVLEVQPPLRPLSALQHRRLLIMKSCDAYTMMVGLALEKFVGVEFYMYDINPACYQRTVACYTNIVCDIDQLVASDVDDLQIKSPSHQVLRIRIPNGSFMILDPTAAQYGDLFKDLATRDTKQTLEYILVDQARYESHVAVSNGRPPISHHKRTPNERLLAWSADRETLTREVFLTFISALKMLQWITGNKDIGLKYGIAGL